MSAKEAAKAPDAPKSESAKAVEEKVWWVKFSDKSDANQPDDVQLGVNGEIIVIKRNERIPLLDRYKVAAENATYPRFTQLPNEPRKQVGTIRVYPFDTLGEATMDDWNRFRTEGTAKARAAADAGSVK
jgi:hypothetical protein